MSKSWLAVLLAACFTLGHTAVLAAPPEGKGKPDKGPSQSKDKGNKKAQQDDNHSASATALDDYLYSKNGKQISRHYNDPEQLIVAGLTGLIIEEILGEQAASLHVGAKPLPPGIAKNLARGKPLPPGIAKQRVSGPLLDHLPHVDGHDWLQVGTELVLVAIATGIVVEIIDEVFD